MTLPKKSTLRKGTLHHKTLLRRRTNILGSAELIQIFNDEYDVTQVNQVAIRIERLDELWEKFEDVQDEIEVIEDEQQEFSETRQQFQNHYFELKAALVGKLPQRDPAPILRPSSSLPPAPQTISVKLPELKIPEFRGNPEEWIEFHDLFKSVIHGNTQLSNVQKLHYLRSSLKGEASRLISSLSITSDNYLIAWKIVCDRYENTNFLIKQHMSAILKIGSIKKESATALAELADEFNHHVGILNKLEEENAHWNSFLVERLSSLLDEKSLMDWETQCKEEETPTYEDLFEFIHKRSRTLQKCKSAYNPTGSVHMKSSKRKTSSSPVASENVTKCLSCKQAHSLIQCEAFLTLSPNSRLDFAKRHRLCINCLRGGHIAKDCRSSMCRTCGKKHHSMLHLPPLTSASSVVDVSNDVQYPSTSQACTVICRAPSTTTQTEISHSVTDTPPVVLARSLPQASASVLGNNPSSVVTVEKPPSASSVVPSGNLESEHCFQEPATSLTQSSNVRESTIFLSTAVIRVRDVNDTYHFARALLDSGSQSNFVSESMCQKLGLKRTRINLPVSGIGQATVNVHYKVNVTFASRFGGFEQQLECLVLPRLTKTVLGYVVSGKATTQAFETVVCHVTTNQDLNSQLERLWEVEDFDVGKTLTQEEQYVEDHFNRTVSRDESGRYVVRLPFRESLISLLGDSCKSALNRFSLMEKRFAKDNELRDEYNKFMEDYIRLGHMGQQQLQSTIPSSNGIPSWESC
ncbi:uncharacterized protein LOC135704726 [Ochlerotatus camptorhynchus]|uniref:uncharacterized protein LOC135704726 n=1 Tax=Ochlerotatus camptorhynchus TaxID=644619 RepID=UPI0031DFAA81